MVENLMNKVKAGDRVLYDFGNRTNVFHGVVGEIAKEHICIGGSWYKKTGAYIYEILSPKKKKKEKEISENIKETKCPLTIPTGKVERCREDCAWHMGAYDSVCVMKSIVKTLDVIADDE